MTSDPIDIHDPLLEICNRLGLTYEHVAEIVLQPLSLTATVFTSNENGRLHVDLDTGEVAQETRMFRITT